MSRGAPLLPPESFRHEFATELRGVVRCAAQRLVVSSEVIVDVMAANRCITPDGFDEVWKDRTTAAELLCEFVEGSYDQTFGDMQQMHAAESIPEWRNRAWDHTWHQLLAAVVTDLDHGMQMTEGVAGMFDDLSRQRMRGMYGPGRFHAYAQEHDPGTRLFYEVFGEFVPNPSGHKQK